MLHQGILHYAGSLSQVARNEWIKIEGRFNTLQYVDDSEQIYKLIGTVVRGRFSGKRPTRRKLGTQAKQARQLGLYQDFSVSEFPHPRALSGAI